MNSEVTTGYILAAILVAAGITFLLRLLPFGLKKALEQFPDARSVSIDTWGVDWAPLDENGDLVGDVIAYRDERTSRTLDAFRERIGDREFFDLTGNQPATINTANQLFAYLQENPATR